MIKCIYFLYDNEDVVRYVGQGNINRARDINTARSKEFKEIIKSGGRLVIIEDNLSKEDAYYKEKKLLDEYFNGKHPDWNLVNKTRGTRLKHISYDSIKDKLKIDNSSPTNLVWNYDCVKTNGALCSKARVGFKAGSINKNRYCTVIIDGITYPVHRIVWSLYNKCDLSIDKVVNHIDGNPNNNSPENLEAVTQKENVHKTTKKNPPKSTGIVGVRIVDGLVIAYFSDKNCKQHTKSFSINKYGNETAISLAVSWRNQRMINEYGEDFTYSHLGGIIHEDIKRYCDLDEYQTKLLEENYEINERYRTLVVNRKRIIRLRSDFIQIFGTDSVANRLNNWLRDGFIGIVIHGCLIEEYNSELHKNANEYNTITPVESLRVHISKAIIGGGNTYLSPSDFSIRVKGHYNTSTAWLVSTQMKKGRPVYGVYYKEGTIEDINREIIRRLEEHEKEIGVD